MSSAGQQLVAGRVPGERIATAAPRTSNSSGFTAETEVDTVTAALVSGRTYRVTWAGAQFSTVADGNVRFRIREDSVTGTVLQLIQLQTAAQTINQAYPGRMEAEYTAVSTGNKTFSATGQRNTGTGTITAQAAATAPTYFYVDYIRG